MVSCHFLSCFEARSQSHRPGSKMRLVQYFSLFCLARGSNAFQQAKSRFPSKDRSFLTPAKFKSFKSMVAPSTLMLSTDSSSSQDSINPKYNHDNPRFFNSHGFRAAAVLATLYGVGYASGVTQSPLQLFSNQQVMITVHLLAFGIWFGSIVYSTFVGGITMVKNLPRPMFGKVQSKLFPKFFKLCTCSIVVEVRRRNLLQNEILNFLCINHSLFDISTTS